MQLPLSTNHCILKLPEDVHLENHNVSKSSITTLFLTTICHSEARCLGCALTDWPYAQVSYIPFTHPSLEYLHPIGVVREGSSPQIAWM